MRPAPPHKANTSLAKRQKSARQGACLLYQQAAAVAGHQPAGLCTCCYIPERHAITGTINPAVCTKHMHQHADSCGAGARLLGAKGQHVARAGSAIACADREQERQEVLPHARRQLLRQPKVQQHLRRQPRPRPQKHGRLSAPSYSGQSAPSKPRMVGECLAH